MIQGPETIAYLVTAEGGLAVFVDGDTVRADVIGEDGIPVTNLTLGPPDKVAAFLSTCISLTKEHNTNG